MVKKIIHPTNIKIPLIFRSLKVAGKKETILYWGKCTVSFQHFNVLYDN